MKNNLLKNQVVILLLIVFFVQAGFAKAVKKVEENWPQIFAAEIVKSKSKLGPQCFYKSNAEYQAAKKKPSQDVELQMSYSDYQADLQKNGLHINFNNLPQMYETQSICHLTPNEYLAIRIYTASYYRQINTALRELNLAELKKFRLTIKFLMSGLAKLKDYVGVTKRGTSLRSELISGCKADAAFADRGFLSTSVAAGFGGQYRFILASQSCKYVAPFSSFPNEEEVLCRPGTVFQIRYFNQKPNGNEVILQQAGDAAAKRLNLEDLIETLENHPEVQNPLTANYWSQSCQPESVIFEKETPSED